MKGLIINYRRGRHTQNPYQMILKFEGAVDKETAEKLKGKRVIWTTSSGKKLEGKILGSHGNRGAVKARFERGLPGQAIGTEIELK
ncbi:MAG: 50S ribosomal protein L35ae [Candidatus Altiarchaeota archaeon]|nr:50S ribosomal protein L35ae [Candidatus Altiarchaeota archaeon]